MKQSYSLANLLRFYAWFTEESPTTTLISHLPSSKTADAAFFAESDYDTYRSSQVAKTESGFACLLCGTAVKKQIRRHFEDLHMLSDVAYACPVGRCGKVIDRRRYFVEHINRAHPEFRGLEPEKCAVRRSHS